jgi:type VII secretion-associated serine protease mycosin
MDQRRFSPGGTHRVTARFIPFMITAMMVAVMTLPISTYAQGPSGEKSSPELPPQAGGRFVPGEILVKFKPAVGQLSAQHALEARSLQVSGAIQSIGVLQVAVESGRELETIAALRQDPNVLYAEPNYIAYALDTIPNDPGYGSQWGLPKIGAPAAWDITTGGSDVTIAVVDTGIDLSHPDLSCFGKLTPGWDFVNNDATPDDDFGHGSHVAGIAAACTNNSTGVAGVAWGARLMPVKVLNAYGSGSYEQVANGITYAVDHGADIINLSLGGSENSTTLADAVQYADDHGVLVVCAAGNCAQDGYQCGYLYNPLMYPAAYPTTLAVAATDSSDNWADFSEHHPYVDVAAPGVSIYSTWRNDSYISLQGTSMSTPYVAGLAALIWSFDPSLTHDQVRDLIQSTADDLGAPGKDDYFGYGRINAQRALESRVSLQTSSDQIGFLVDNGSGPFPASKDIQITTNSPNAINWAANISPPVSWLSVAPPAYGTVSAASAASFTLVASRPAAYGTYNTQVIVIGTTPSGGTIGPEIIQVHISYVPDLYECRFPAIFKNYAP